MVKFIIFIVYTTLIFFLPNSYWIIILIFTDLIIMSAAHFICGSNIHKITIGTLKFLPFVLLAFLFNLWLDEPENAFWISYKLLIACQATMIYASTTSNLEVAITIQKLCAPLKLFHVDTTDIKILVCVALSLIPTLRRQLLELRLACSAKHLQINFRTAKPILIRFFTQVFNRIEQIEASLLAKGYRES